MCECSCPTNRSTLTLGFYCYDTTVRWVSARDIYKYTNVQIQKHKFDGQMKSGKELDKQIYKYKNTNSTVRWKVERSWTNEYTNEPETIQFWDRMTQVQLRRIITIFSCSLASHVLGLLRIPSRTIEYHRTPCIGCHTLAQEVTNEKCPSCIIRAGDSKDGCCVKLYLMMPWCGWCRRWCWWCCRWRWLQKGMMAGKGVKDDNCKA